MKKPNLETPKTEDLLSNPDTLRKGGIEWLSDAVEFDYDSFVITYENGVWTASHWDEDAFEEDMIIHNPENEVEMQEEVDLFGEHTLTVEEFTRLQEMAHEAMDH